MRVSPGQERVTLPEGNQYMRKSSSNLVTRILLASAMLLACIAISDAQSSQGGDGFAWNRSSQSW